MAHTDRQGNKIDCDYEVSLVTTPCYYGGVRYWFSCSSCGRRVAVLYLAPGGVYFRCRHCNNLSYWSRNRCTLESFGHIDREIEKLRSEIKRRTWRGRPTRKVRRLYALERKMGILSGPIMAQMEKSKARLR
jgi:pyruvate-formate lyase-activating enzyme